MNKKEYIKNLKNVKIVLGNGFDLHCGLHTKYSDYYCENINKYLFIREKLNLFRKEKIFNLDINDIKDYSINTWDVFFAINGKDNPKECKSNWCDIEKTIYSSFMLPDNSEIFSVKEGADRLCSKIKWNTIKMLLSNNLLGKSDEDRFMVEFIKKRSLFLACELKDFYGFLLKELKVFEKDFGTFIYKQFHNTYFESFHHSVSSVNEDYLEKAILTIDELCGRENISSIDSFNYTLIENPLIMKKFQNINGSYKNPIFGIDTKFIPDDERYIFSKTCRRIESDIVDETFERKEDFDNVLIYGHSLNEADYSYFFPLFDELNLIDSTASGVLIFAYSIFDNSKKETIEIDLRKAISEIVYEYAISKNMTKPERLLDTLSTQKRIFTYKIEEFEYNGMPKTYFELKWEEIYKKVDLLIDKKA